MLVGCWLGVGLVLVWCWVLGVGCRNAKTIVITHIAYFQDKLVKTTEKWFSQEQEYVCISLILYSCRNVSICDLYFVSALCCTN